jgi:hypothetical protein
MFTKEMITMAAPIEPGKGKANYNISNFYDNLPNGFAKLNEKHKTLLLNVQKKCYNQPYAQETEDDAIKQVAVNLRNLYSRYSSEIHSHNEPTGLGISLPNSMNTGDRTAMVMIANHLKVKIKED